MQGLVRRVATGLDPALSNVPGHFVYSFTVSLNQISMD